MFSHLYHLLYHLDDTLLQVIHQYGAVTYLIIFVLIFSETGLVVTPFLPGDGLLFATGVLSAAGALNIVAILIVVTLAAIAGNMVNYHVGRAIRPGIFLNPRNHLLKRKHLESTQAFYTKYGAHAIIISRFMPYMRTFIPFVAGISLMHRPIPGMCPLRA